MPGFSDFEKRIDPETGEQYVAVKTRGTDLLMNPLLNKGIGFSREERRAFNLTGLLPDHIASLDEQASRVHDQFIRKPTELDRNVYLNGLMDRNETLFYRFILDHLEETVPIIYTPTVAYVCRHWSRIFRRARGVYVTPRDRGHIAQMLAVRQTADRPVIVVTDNERILGIGDQGAGGMGIPIGKLALYTAGAGIDPARTLPISLDVGTNNPELLDDALYVGYREHRLRGEEYDSFIAEFVDAVREVFPKALLQWEDFANRTSFHNLEAYRDVLPSFNDDIQGTAAMVVAGLLAATAHSGARMREQRVVIVGAGSAGIGIREQIAMAMIDDGASASEAHDQILVLDSRGLVVEGRPDLTPGKARLAVRTSVIHDWQIDDHPIGLNDVVRNAKATVLIGVSGVPGIFSQEIVSRMARFADRPIIMPLSN
ncbi:MAG: oxaloacetate-decarboxylating malate dehydrogenase, partial [Acidimicrobiia bacterium]